MFELVVAPNVDNERDARPDRRNIGEVLIRPDAKVRAAAYTRS
jgi:hypothetical protein